MKSIINSIKERNIKNILHKEDLNKLDDYIQKCLDVFKFVEPKKELYEAAGNDRDAIISHKSTIPDLVIWNKTFNKNKCFIGANTSNPNDFPRFLFYIKIKKNKKTKNMNNNNDKNIKNEKNNKNDFNIDFFGSNQNILKNENNINNINNKENNINSININNNNNSNCINFQHNNVTHPYNEYKINEVKNKFSYLQNINNTNMINLTIFLIEIYLNKNGWIILTNEQFSGPGTSINLFQFLQEKMKEKIDLNEFIIIDINKQVKYYGNYFYILLSNILPKIIQKNNLEFIGYEQLLKKYQNQHILDINHNIYQKNSIYSYKNKNDIFVNYNDNNNKIGNFNNFTNDNNSGINFIENDNNNNNINNPKINDNMNSGNFLDC